MIYTVLNPLVPMLDYRCNCPKLLSEPEDITKKSVYKRDLFTKAKSAKMLLQGDSRRRVIMRAMQRSKTGCLT